MKPISGMKLQTKIFLSCILILIAVEIVIFLLVRPVAVKHMNRKIWDYIEYRSQAFREMMEETLEQYPSDTDLDVRVRQQFINDLAQVWKAKVWISSLEGETFLRSFEGPVPSLPEEKMVAYKNVWFVPKDALRELGLPNPLFTRVSIRFLGKESAFANVLFGELDESIVNEAATVVRWTFILFLAGIAFGVALLLFPVVLLINKPLRSLSRSVAEFSDGDLSHRVNVQSEDEIGELGRTFNRMADTIEGMITGIQELTTNISHELRTPLSRIRIALELHREKLRRAGEEIPCPHLDSMQEDIEDMDRLVGQILQLSKLDMKKASPRADEVDLGAFVREAMERFSSAIQGKSIELEMNIASDPLFIRVDREDMATAVSNLLDNAVKYTPPGGRIELNVQRNENRTEAWIANTCHPLADEEIHSLFEPFYRASSPSDASGTGLGLTITKKIVENNGGRIKASPWENQGFRISLSFG